MLANCSPLYDGAATFISGVAKINITIAIHSPAKYKNVTVLLAICFSSCLSSSLYLVYTGTKETEIAVAIKYKILVENPFAILNASVTSFAPKYDAWIIDFTKPSTFESNVKTIISAVDLIILFFITLLLA